MMCRSDGIGRRAGLKILWWQHRAGSTPAFGTNFFVDVLELVDKIDSESIVHCARKGSSPFVGTRPFSAFAEFFCA